MEMVYDSSNKRSGPFLSKQVVSGIMDDISLSEFFISFSKKNEYIKEKEEAMPEELINSINKIAIFIENEVKKIEKAGLELEIQKSDEYADEKINYINSEFYINDNFLDDFDLNLLEEYIVENESSNAEITFDYKYRDKQNEIIKKNKRLIKNELKMKEKREIYNDKRSIFGGTITNLVSSLYNKKYHAILDDLVKLHIIQTELKNVDKKIELLSETSYVQKKIIVEFFKHLKNIKPEINEINKMYKIYLQRNEKLAESRYSNIYESLCNQQGASTKIAYVYDTFRVIMSNKAKLSSATAQDIELLEKSGIDPEIVRWYLERYWLAFTDEYFHDPIDNPDVLKKIKTVKYK